MSASTLYFEAESYRVVEERDEFANPLMAPWNAIASCFGVKCGGEDGWPDGSAILDKALENLAKFPESLGLSFSHALKAYRASKNAPLPLECELKDEIRKSHYNSIKISIHKPFY